MVSKSFISKDNNENCAPKSRISYYTISIENFIGSDRYHISQDYFLHDKIWDLDQASLFIESILLNLPVPSIITCYKKNKEYIVDGFQRLVCIRDFLNNGFKLTNVSYLSELNGLKYTELPLYYKKFIKEYVLHITLCYDFDNSQIKEICYRINFNHRLKNQIDYNGNNDLKNIIDEIMSYKAFKDIFMNIPLKEQAEYILRFLALYENLDLYNGNMKEFVKSYIYKTKGNINLEKKRELILTFKNTFDACLLIFGKDVFRNCICLQTPKGIRNIMYKSISKPVFDLQMLGVSNFSFAQIYRNSVFIKQKYEECLKKDDNFNPHFKRMSRRAVEYRLRIWHKLIQDVVG